MKTKSWTHGNSSPGEPQAGQRGDTGERRVSPVMSPARPRPRARPRSQGSEEEPTYSGAAFWLEWTECRSWGARDDWNS